MRPLLKWVGGKSRLLRKEAFTSLFPDSCEHYIEPFLGGGSVFLWVYHNLSPSTLTICDNNWDLVNFYRAVKSNWVQLTTEIAKLVDRYNQASDESWRKEVYQEARDKLNSCLDHRKGEEVDSYLASLFYFLNRTGFNGLFRVNRKGLFNTPIGDCEHLVLSKEVLANFKDWHDLLSLDGITLKHQSYENTIELVKDDSFIYYDPPYIPLSLSSNFTSYTTDVFNLTHHEKLSVMLDTIEWTTGAKQMLSNSGSILSRSLYIGYNIWDLEVRRSISANTKSRGDVKEIAVTSYNPLCHLD